MRPDPAPLLVVVAIPTLILLPPLLTGNQPPPPPPKLLLVSFDSFGNDLLGKLPPSQLPGFRQFTDSGVHVRWVENVFPSITRPMHMTMVTGLYPESHGVVENKFYDPLLRGYMPLEGVLRADDSKWMDVGAEPIWVTNSKAGNGRRSGTIYFPCADARIKGYLPDEIRTGEWSVPEEAFTGFQRVDLALDWLTGRGRLSGEVNFAAMYTHEPDGVMHKYGPHSVELLEVLRSRDRIVGYLLSEMRRRGLDGELNVIITSDHGQLALFPEHSINIDDLIDSQWYEAVPPFGNKATTHLWPRQGYYQKVVDALKGKHPHLHVAAGEESADLVKLHYSASRRISPIVIYADPGWVIVSNHSPLKYKGQHGWDPKHSPRLWPFFLARGPAFQRGLRDADPFSILDIYPLMCHVLGLTPAPNNGSLVNAAHILSPESRGNIVRGGGGGVGGAEFQSYLFDPNVQGRGYVSFQWVAVGLLVAILAAASRGNPTRMCRHCQQRFNEIREKLYYKRMLPR